MATIKYGNFKKQFYANKETIVKLFNECEERRVKVEEVNNHIANIKTKILSSGEYLTSKEHIDLVGFDVVLDQDYVVFITKENGLSDKFNKKLFDVIMSDEMLNEYFDLSEMKSDFICGLYAHLDLKKDFELMNILRTIKGDKLKSLPLDIDIHKMEYKIIKEMITLLLK